MKYYSGFIPDMGSFSPIAGTSLEGILWDINRMRDHDDLPHLTINSLRRWRRLGNIKITRKDVQHGH